MAWTKFKLRRTGYNKAQTMVEMVRSFLIA